MSSNPDKPPRKLWINSVPLKRAWLHFTHPKNVEEWNALKSQSAFEAFQKGAQEVAASEKSLAEKLSVALSQPQSILIARTTLQKKMQNAVVGYLRDEQLFAYGFEPPRRMGTQPLEIPKYYWSGQIDWIKSTLTFNGIQFVEVRLISASKRAKVLELAPVPKTGSEATPGRPGFEADILEAHKLLLDAGKFNPNASLKSQCPAIRNWLIENKLGKGYSSKKPGYEVIRKYLQKNLN